MQLFVDGEGISAALLLDTPLMFGLLLELPELLGMHRIGGPFIIPRPAKDEKEMGLCGYVFIAESHIDVDTYMAEYMARLSIFSCKDFNTEILLRRFIAVYHPTKFGWQVTPRTAGRYEEMVADS